MGNSRPWRRRLAQPTAFEKKMQKRLRKATGTNIKFRMKQEVKNPEYKEGDE